MKKASRTRRQPNLKPDKPPKLLPAHVSTLAEGPDREKTATLPNVGQAEVQRTPAPYKPDLTSPKTPTSSSASRSRPSGLKGVRAAKPLKAPLPEALREARDEIAALFADVEAGPARANKADILSRHKIGTKVAAIESSPGKYGNDPVGKLAVELGRKAQRLYELAALARAWTRDEVMELADREGKDGFRLTSSHLVVLASIVDLVKQVNLIERTLAHELSVANLKKEVAGKAINSAAIRSSTGAVVGSASPAAVFESVVDAPEHSAPLTYRSGILEISAMTNGVVGRATIWQEVIFNRLAALKDDDLLDETLDEDVTDAEAAVTSAARFLEEQRAQLAAVRTRIQAARAKRDGEAYALPPEPKEDHLNLPVVREI